MDSNAKWVIEKKVERTIEALRNNNMEGYFVKDESEAREKISEILNAGDVVSVGGSRTLFETGVIEMLREGDYKFLDRYEEGLTPDDIKKIYRGAFSADAYLASTNAITEEGELYNVDGTGNRVAAMIYGPDTVIVLVGTNKIVKDFHGAVERNKRMAAPANGKRLGRKTPCSNIGYCKECSSPDRMCNAYTLIRKQAIKGRIKVIIVDKELGY